VLTVPVCVHDIKVVAGDKNIGDFVLIKGKNGRYFRIKQTQFNGNRVDSYYILPKHESAGIAIRLFVKKDGNNSCPQTPPSRGRRPYRSIPSSPFLMGSYHD
jgi:hypothetical protein